MSHVVKLQDKDQLVLPASLVGRSDIARMVREIEKVDYDFETQTVRTPDQPLTIPAMSRGLSEVVARNQIAVEDFNARKALLSKLRMIKDKAPGIQVTFAIDPDPEIIGQLVAWVRENLHPNALVNIGLQPAIVGGCIVRTPDHIYDFSLRGRFKQVLPELTANVRALNQA